MNEDLFTVSCLLISFIIIVRIVAFMKVYYILSAVCKTMLWMYSFCLLPLFVSPQNMIVGYFLVCLYIFFTL